MIQGLLLALLAALVYGLLGVTFEVAGKRNYRIWDFILCKQFVGFLIGLLVSIYSDGELWQPKLLLLALLGAISYVLTCSSYLVAARERDIAANWTIVNLSVILPILVSIIWFGDKFTASKAAGGAFTLCSIVLIGGGVKAAPVNSRWLQFILLAFVFNGIVTVLFRWVPSDSAALFTAYFYGISCLIVLPYKLLQGKCWTLQPGLLQVSAVGALSHWGGMMLTMLSLSIVSQVSTQPGLIVYPITNGLVIPLGVVLGVLLLQQNVTTRSRWGVIAGMAGLLMLFLP